MIDSNTIIMGIFKVVRDAYTLAQGWRKWAICKQPWKNSLKMMKRQGFEQEDNLIGFCGNETTIFLNDEVVSSGVDDSHTGFKGRRNPPKRPLGSNLARNHNLNKEPSHEDSMIVMRLRVGE
jgi:hypothetical protein